MLLSGNRDSRARLAQTDLQNRRRHLGRDSAGTLKTLFPSILEVVCALSVYLEF